MTHRLTAEQRELWQRAYPDGVRPSGRQTQEQAENFAVDSFRAACQLAGLEPVPSEEAVRAEMDQVT